MNVIIFCVDVSKVMVAVLILILIVNDVLLIVLSCYNSDNLINKCEMCGDPATETHHMYPQEIADENGFIEGFKKNHAGNLMSICNKCHKGLTKNKVVHRKTKMHLDMSDMIKQMFTYLDMIFEKKNVICESFIFFVICLFLQIGFLLKNVILGGIF